MGKTALLAAAITVAVSAGGQVTGGHSQLGCGTCHIAHSPKDVSAAALWTTTETADGLPYFTLYSSRTFDALGTDIGQPDGPSKLCLGCHDGSYTGLPAGSRAVFRPDDLARSHPVSFTYDSSLAARVPGGGLNDPSLTVSGLGGTIAQDLLDEKGKVQCTSCHDVHSTGKGRNHLRYDYNPRARTDGGMCRTCHNR